MIVQFRNEKLSNQGSIPITIDCNVVAFIVFEEGFHQPIKRTKHFHAEIVEVEIEVVSPSTVPSGNFTELNRTVACMVLKTNDRRTSSPMP
ncbi:hypothetical protein TNCV_375981 [Trichonephila clavipes]|nr:hypothetical protein TNCV_375981 [Trichonephila clavipes]